MTTKITFEGLTTSYYDGRIHSINKEVGYCIEEPLEVLRGLACSHKIRNYQDYDGPFGGWYNGLCITGSEGPKGTTITGTLDELSDILDNIAVHYDGCYPCSPKLDQPISLDELRGSFLDSLAERFSQDGSKINTERYWRMLDCRLLWNMTVALDISGLKGAAYGLIMRPYEKFLVPYSEREEGMETLLPKIRKKVPQLNQRIESVALTELHKELGLQKSLELISLFGIENATCYDLKKMFSKLK